MIVRSFAFGVIGGSIIGFAASSFGSSIVPGPYQVPITFAGMVVGGVVGPFLVYRDIKNENSAKQVIDDEFTLADIRDFLALRSGAEYAILDFSGDLQCVF